MSGPDRIGDHAVTSWANAFPMRTDLVDRIAASIKRNGLRRPIILLGCSAPDVMDGAVLQGRHRYEACIKAKVAPRFKAYDGDESPEALAEYVEDEELLRRDLRQDERVQAADELVRLTREARKHNKNQPVLTGVEMAHDDELARIKDDGIPELKDAVDRNEIPKKSAAKIALLEPAAQLKEVEKILAPKPHKAIVEADQWLPPKAERLACASTCVRCSANVIEHRHGLRCARCGPLVQWKGT